MNACDCPIALGAIITDDYLDIMKQSFARMISVNDEEARIGVEYFHHVTLGDFVRGLIERFRANPGVVAPSFKPPKPPAIPPRPAANAKPEEPLSYNVFYNELGAFLLGRDLLTSSSLILGESTSLYVFGNLFGMPRDSFVANAAWGSLGHETGSALGVMLGSGRRAFVVAGDGGFRMVCQELSSLALAKCNAIVFVMSNNVYAIEQAFVDLKAFQTGQFAGFDTLPPWDYPALAQAFGVVGKRVATVGALRQALDEVLALRDRPALIEVVIPKTDLAPQLKRLAETP
jgi:indolepyruvate decarboxylase